MKEKNDKKILIIFIILSFFLGTIFSILIPIYQVPDEETHINNLYSFLGEKIKFTEENTSYNDMLRIIRNYDEKVDINNYINFNERLDIIDNVKGVSIGIIRYFPQTIGIIISEILNLPVIVALTISEVLAVIFYTVLGVKTLKLMPIKKEIMMMVMLLPISIQQMGSFSYDMMLLSLTFLFIAYVFSLKFNNKDITNKQVFKLIFLILMIALIKLPYILLGLLIFILPLNKIVLVKQIKNLLDTKMKKILFGIVLIIICIIGGMFLIRINYIKVLLAFIFNPIDGILLVFRTLKEHLGFYVISIMGYFGWHDTPVSILFGLFIILNLVIVSILCDDNKEKKLSKGNSLYLILFGIFASIIIIISLFDWTIQYNGTDTTNFAISDYGYYMANMDSILGVQGRYFIPFIPLVIIPLELGINGLKKKKISKMVQSIHYVILIVYMLIIIVNRYWV